MLKLEMREHSTKGILITFCGLDGSGKTTMIQMLSEWLNEVGVKLYLTKQPTDFVRQSRIFRAYMDEPDHEAYDYRSLSLLAASDRIQHGNKVILPQLQKGEFVISDRYIYSCVANLRARGYTKDQWIFEIVQSIIKPDISFFLDVPVDIAISRVRNRESEKDRYIDVSLQYKLRDEYLSLAKENDGIVLSSIESKEKLFTKVKNHVMKCMEAQK